MANERQRASVNPMAPYFVQMREAERRMIRGAFDSANHDIELTATVLGVHKHYVKARAKLLGGVFKNEPKHEPPGLAAKAWQATSPSGRKSRKAAAMKVNAHVLDAPDGPVCRCGQPSRHESGWCGDCVLDREVRVEDA